MNHYENLFSLYFNNYLIGLLQNIKTSYDFIIIGAGSAGAVIANRLSEVADWNILLLEAGGDESMAGQIPIFAASLQLTNKDWQYKTTPQKNACLKNLNQQYFETFLLTS